MSNVPEISVIHDKTRKKCALCSSMLKPGDIVIDYVSSFYGNNSHISNIHLTCLLDSAPKECEFEVLLKILSKQNGGK
jgi:hypothetical protein